MEIIVASNLLSQLYDQLAGYKSILLPKEMVLPSSCSHLIACASTLTCAPPDDKIKKVIQVKTKLSEEVS